MKYYWKDTEKANFYEQYKEAQTSLNTQKFNTTWVIESEIKKLSDYIINNITDLTCGICHGSRNGNEVSYFQKHLNIANIIGTDISPTANKVPNLIVWDFHDLKSEWVGKFDFVYSNSIDHAYDPFKCLETWNECLNESGIGIIHFNPISMKKSQHATKNSADCFSATEEELIEIVKSKTNYIETLELYKDKKNDRKSIIFKKNSI